MRLVYGVSGEHGGYVYANTDSLGIQNKYIQSTKISGSTSVSLAPFCEVDVLTTAPQLPVPFALLSRPLKPALLVFNQFQQVSRTLRYHVCRRDHAPCLCGGPGRRRSSGGRTAPSGHPGCTQEGCWQHQERPRCVDCAASGADVAVAAATVTRNWR